MQIKYAVLVTMMLIIILSTLIMLSISVSSESKNYALNITEGSTYVYEIAPYNLSSTGFGRYFLESHVKDLDPHLNLNEINFMITVQRDYQKVQHYLSHSKLVSVNGVNPLETGIIACKNVYIIIKINNIENSRIIVNVTLSMKKGYARFGINYYPLPSTDTGWSLKDDFYVSYFNSLNMSKILIIDKNNYNVKDLTGFDLGEWPFWLKSVKNSYESILYGLDDTASVEGFDVTKPIFGVAEIIILNTSSVAPEPFILNNIYIKPEDQIYSNKSMLGSEERILNIKPNEKENVIAYLKELRASHFHQCTGCKKLIAKLIFPTIITYDNNTNAVIIKTDISHDIFNDKPWTYINDIATHETTAILPNIGERKILTILHGIEYKGFRYITMGFSDLEAVSYDKSSGLLLYIIVRNEGNLMLLNSIFPSVIVRAFGIIGYELTRYSELSMKLINYNP